MGSVAVAAKRQQTLVAELHRTPAVAAHIDAVVVDGQAFFAQACALLIATRATRRQAQASAGTEHAVPGQAGVRWQLAQGAADPARGAAESGQCRQFAIAGDLARRDL